MKRIISLGMLFLCLGGSAWAATSSTGTDSEVQEGWLQGPGRAPVLLIETISSALDEVLIDLGVAFDTYYGADFSALDLSTYEHVFLGMDGGIVEEPSVLNIANYAASGGALHIYGGTQYIPWVEALDAHLLGNDVTAYNWTIVSGLPHTQMINPGHYLARDLPASFTFVDPAASYYQLRPADPNLHVAAVNGDGIDHLFAKNHGAGTLDACTNSPTEGYYTDPGDLAWMRQVVINMLRAQEAEVMVIQTTNSAVPAILTELGIRFELYEAIDFSAVDLTPYAHVFVAMDGGSVSHASVSNAAGYAFNGGHLHFLGGTAVLEYNQAVNDLLVQNDVSTYNWVQVAGSPHSMVINGAHPLAKGLPYEYNFASSAATFYQLRVTEPFLATAAVNGDGYPHLFSKPIGFGTFDHSINSPNSNYYSDPGDWGWISQVVRNMVGAGNPHINSVIDVPNDQGRQVRITWEGSYYDHWATPFTITNYVVWRRIDPEMERPAPVGLVPDHGPELRYPPGTWEYVLTVPARGEPTYNVVAPTLCDAMNGDICYSEFFVSAVTWDPLIYFDSAPAMGYSVDNLAPEAPLFLRIEGVADLTWEPVPDEDLNYYSVYTADSADFTDYDLFAVTTDLAVDVTAAWGKYLAVTAQDFSGNESPFSNVVDFGISGVEDGVLPDRVVLAQNHPNPFNPRTEIRFALPRSQVVTLRVFDVAGRVVRVLVDGQTLSAGWHTAVLQSGGAGQQPLESGLYFYRLETADRVETRKMTLLK